MPSTMQIGEVAALFDVTTKTLRHYEKLGLLQPERADNGYRLYGPEDVLRLQRIRQLQALGLSLKEIARLLGDTDELLWEEVLRSLQDEVATEMALLRERLERIEQLLAEGLPPDEESLPAPPDSVNEYLEEHLSRASRAAWRRDNRIYASLHRLLDTPFGAGGQSAFPQDPDTGQQLPLHIGQPLMLPSQMVVPDTGLDGLSTAAEQGDGDRRAAGERAILRLLLSQGHLQAFEEDSE